MTLGGLGLILLLFVQVAFGGVFNGNDDSEKEICYGALGCFGTGYPFLDPPYRAVSVLPESPATIGTTFYLNTHKNPAVPQVLDNTDGSTLLGSYFDPAKETKIICHGFTENGNKQWLVDMAMELLNYGDYNVIRTDWGEGSLALYSIAVANTRVVGAEMSLLIDLIKEVYELTSVSSFHLIGHSLGSHIVGYAGERQADIGRITGLDPAGPYYEATDPRVRLDETDALFVDVMHTDTNPIWNLGMGIYQASGHLDFYVNGGNDQPGCDQSALEQISLEGGLVDGGVQFVACNHLRAYEFFTSSIANRCHDAYQCQGDYQADFIEGSCVFTHQIAEMGFHAGLYKPEDGSKNMIYYQRTTAAAPFCGFQYRFEIHFDDPRRAEKGKGHIFVTLINTDGVQERTQLTQTMQEFSPGKSYMYMAATSSPLGTLTGMYFDWEYDAAWYKPWEWDIFTRPDFYIHRINVYSAHDFTSYIMCGSTDAIEANRDVASFFPVSKCN